MFSTLVFSLFAAAFAWWVVWPLEYMKSQVQGEYGGEKTLVKRMSGVVRDKGGLFGLYLGIR